MTSFENIYKDSSFAIALPSDDSAFGLPRTEANLIHASFRPQQAAEAYRQNHSTGPSHLLPPVLSTDWMPQDNTMAAQLPTMPFNPEMNILLPSRHEQNQLQPPNISNNMTSYPKSLKESHISTENYRGRQESTASFTDIRSERARSLSSTTNALLDSADADPPSRAGSPTRDTAQSPEPEEEDDNPSPFPKRERPRSEPTIVDSKYVCTQCDIKPFDRRCEWK